MIGRVTIRAEIPIPKPIFAILDPMIFPKTKSPDPLSAANIDTTNSGKLVPKATTLRPTKIGGTSSAVAISLAPSIKKSAPLRIAASATMKMRIAISIDIIIEKKKK